MTDDPGWEFKERDVIILRELARDPQRSARALTEVLEEEYEIDVSHVTVSKSIRNMREAGVFRETILPNETYFVFALFEFQLDPAHLDDGWRDVMEYVRTHENTLVFFVSDGEYRWKSVMMFEDTSAKSRWVHEFYKEHGAVVRNLRTSLMSKVLKFGTNPELFQRLPRNE